MLPGCKKLAKVLIGYGILFWLMYYVYQSITILRLTDSDSAPDTVNYPSKRVDKYVDSTKYRAFDRNKRNVHNSNTTIKLSNTAGKGYEQLPTTSVKDIYITVKTTKTSHSTRVRLILDTWWMFARDQVCNKPNKIFFQFLNLDKKRLETF